ncbi:MAG: disulfide oxidoreductase [Rhodospirillaceae bacterium]|nr:disulfide oxidoreductase [Rhodospirillaceae bacterium]
MEISTKDVRVTAVLGPTNTGKTYLAMERLLAHGSGMIGFPLRLLARENYDRAVAIKGARQVALITGEEKIIPSHAKYFFCTVEAMPINKPVDFLAIDEIQICADPDRGHVFTDRLLYARGMQETMFMGSESIRPLLNQLVPGIDFITRPRFSTLSFAGARKIVRLPPRSAVVGFSAADVYAIAEVIRRQRGGAAIVMGALSPRTRNAQVEMFQNGDVDYLVATDAIGMGLNMDVDHVAFAALNKFDGTFRRNLRPEELAQIAGRAGRHMSNGTFGVTGDAPEIEPEIIEQIENHRFDPIKQIQWRNARLDFRSLDHLLSSLAVRPEEAGLVKVRQPGDEKILVQLAREGEVKDRLINSDSVHLLWDVCQIPDFRRQVTGGHSRLLSHIYCALSDTGAIDSNWMAKEVTRIDQVDGGIESLVDRIANIRIWTYISHRGDWLDDPESWQARTREIEDRLSDALHERLTQRFVDQRTAVLVRKLKDKEILQSAVNGEGDVMVEGHFVGRIEGFKFVADATDSDIASRTVTAAAYRALATEVQRRAAALVNADDKALEVDGSGKITWAINEQSQIVARLAVGSDALKPKVKLMSAELLEGAVKDKVEQRLQNWLDTYIAQNLKPLMKARDCDLTGAVRGLVFQLIEGGGVLNKRQAAKQLKALEKRDYGALHHLGIKIGRREVFFPALLRPKPAGLSALLWAVNNEIKPIPELPPPGRVSVPYDASVPFDFMQAAGFRQAGDLSVRIDILERVIGMLKLRSAKGAFEVDPEILNLLGCSAEDVVGVLKSLGYEKQKPISQEEEAPVLFAYEKKSKKKSKKNQGPNKKKQHVKKKRPDTAPEDSPFAKLKELSLS